MSSLSKAMLQDLRQKCTLLVACEMLVGTANNSPPPLQGRGQVIEGGQLRGLDDIIIMIFMIIEIISTLIIDLININIMTSNSHIIIMIISSSSSSSSSIIISIFRITSIGSAASTRPSALRSMSGACSRRCSTSGHRVVIVIVIISDNDLIVVSYSSRNNNN